MLTVIGGLDTRPRLGGLVQHKDLGVGTIAKIENKGRVLVLFHSRKAAKTCVLGILKPVSGYNNCIVQCNEARRVSGCGM